MSACIISGNALFGFVELAVIASVIISVHFFCKYILGTIRLKKSN